MIDFAFVTRAADQLSHKATETLTEEEIGSLVVGLLTGIPSTVVMEGRLSARLNLRRLRGITDVELPSGTTVEFKGEHAAAHSLTMTVLLEAGSPLLVSAMEMIPAYLQARGADWFWIRTGALGWTGKNFPALILSLEKARRLKRGLSLGTQVS